MHCVGHQAWKICSLNWITLFLQISCDQEMPHFQFRSKWESLFFFVRVLWALLFNIKAALGKVAHKWLIKAAFTACKVHQDFTLVCLGRFIFVFTVWGLRTACLFFLFGPIKNDDVDKHLCWLTLLDHARRRKKSSPALLLPWHRGRDAVQLREALRRACCWLRRCRAGSAAVLSTCCCTARVTQWWST